MDALEVWPYVLGFVAHQPAALLRKALHPRLRATMSAVHLQDVDPCGWWELQHSASGRLSCLVTELADVRDADVVAEREASALDPSTAPSKRAGSALVDVRGLRLKGVAVCSRHLASVAISANAAPHDDCAATLGRVTTSKLETLVLSGILLRYASQSLEVLAQASNLRFVALRHCRMVAGWMELAHLPLLEVLDLSGCQLSLDVRVFRTCVSLRRLLVGQNDAPHGFGVLPHLTELDCSQCGLEVFHDLADCVNLKTLNVSGNRPAADSAEGSIAFALRGMTTLAKLNVEDCGFMDVGALCAGLAHKRKATLTQLTLGRHGMEALSAVSAELGALRRLKLNALHANLQSLAFLLAQPMPAHPTRCHALLVQHLCVTDADLSRSGLQDALVWEALPNLVELQLVRCKILSLAGIEACVGAPLKRLDLEGNYLSGSEKDPSLESLVPVMRRGLQSLSLKDASIESLDWLSADLHASGPSSCGARSGGTFPSLTALNVAENGHLMSGGDLIATCCPNLRVLHLAPTFPFDLAYLARTCSALNELHCVHPCVLLGPCTPFRAVAVATVHENALVHGASLTFQFLRHLPDMFPSCETLVVVSRCIQDAHAELVGRLPLLRTLVVVPQQTLLVTNALRVWAAVPFLDRLIVVVPSHQVDGRRVVVSDVERQASHWISSMPPLFIMEMVDTCPFV